MRIAVIGTGYVGLVTGACFSEFGNQVICVDIDKKKVAALRRGAVPIFEPGLSEIIQRNRGKRLTFTTDLKAAVQASDFVFIAVNTPPGQDGEADITNVKAVAREIGKSLNRYKIIINKSTVPIGMADIVARIIIQNGPPDVSFDVVSNPEFLREGSAIEDTLRPDRIVIGAPNQQVAMTLVELYAPLERPMIITDLPSAEVIKYASNAFLAAKISFINAIANICEAAGADVSQVMKGMGLDSRIGMQFLQAGLGYGGSCFPKDVDSLIHTASRLGYDFKLLRSVVEINRERAAHLVEMMRKAMGPLEDKTVAVLGLAFKPNTDDMREAKSLEVVRALHAAGAQIRAYDPVAMENARSMMPPGVVFCESAFEAAAGADGVTLLTEWNEFKYLNLDRLRGLLRRPLIFDARNLYEPERMRRLGFEYYSIGRKPILAG
jgi:UDPglucose 6-dehydrogenase